MKKQSTTEHGSLASPKNVMRHKEARELLAPLALGELPAAEAEALEAHLGDCPVCREELASLRSTCQLLSEAVQELPVRELETKRLADILRPEVARNRRMGKISRWGAAGLQSVSARRWMAAAAMLVLTFVIAVYNLPSPGGGTKAIYCLGSSAKKSAEFKLGDAYDAMGTGGMEMGGEMGGGMGMGGGDMFANTSGSVAGGMGGGMGMNDYSKARSYDGGMGSGMGGGMGMGGAGGLLGKSEEAEGMGGMGGGMMGPAESRPLTSPAKPSRTRRGIRKDERRSGRFLFDEADAKASPKRSVPKPGVVTDLETLTEEPAGESVDFFRNRIETHSDTPRLSRLHNGRGDKEKATGWFFDADDAELTAAPSPPAEPAPESLPKHSAGKDGKLSILGFGEDPGKVDFDNDGIKDADENIDLSVKLDAEGSPKRAEAAAEFTILDGSSVVDRTKSWQKKEKSVPPPSPAPATMPKKPAEPMKTEAVDVAGETVVVGGIMRSFSEAKPTPAGGLVADVKSTKKSVPPPSPPAPATMPTSAVEQEERTRRVLRERERLLARLRQSREKRTEPDSDALPPPSKAPLVPVNHFVMTDKDNLSTFALESENASYALSRRYLRQGYKPPRNVVRMEEFVNNFDYNYPRQAQRTFNVYSEMAPSPFGSGLQLLKIGVKGRILGRDGRKPAHLVFVIDASGSMSRADRLPLVQDGIKLLLQQLDGRDRVSMVTYGTQARLLLEAVPANQRQRIETAIDRIECGASTNVLEGIKLGYGMATRNFRQGRINRVILCSDGVANVGPNDAESILNHVENSRKQGISFTSVGVGSGSYNDRFLEQLANKGDGNYLFIDSREEARRAFVENMSATTQMIARDVKIQVEFDPEYVRRYRLIGYENRNVADKDFRNDKVDAGEIGSGQAATALYELELFDKPADNLGTVFIRYKDVDRGGVHEFATALRHDRLFSPTPEDNPHFYLAACAAEFAEILRGSRYARDGSLPQLEQVTMQVANALPLDNQVRELLLLVQKAQGLPRAE